MNFAMSKTHSKITDVKIKCGYLSVWKRHSEDFANPGISDLVFTLKEMYGLITSSPKIKYPILLFSDVAS